jgi:hypothetical protein
MQVFRSFKKKSLTEPQLSRIEGRFELQALSGALIAPRLGDRRAAGRSATLAGRAPERRRVRTARQATSWWLPPVHQPQPLVLPGRTRPRA